MDEVILAQKNIMGNMDTEEYNENKKILMDILYTKPQISDINNRICK